jgi:hypothetical protein
MHDGYSNHHRESACDAKAHSGHSAQACGERANNATLREEETSCRVGEMEDAAEQLTVAEAAGRKGMRV